MIRVIILKLRDIPEDMKDEAEQWHSDMVEQICETDDDLNECILMARSLRYSS